MSLYRVFKVGDQYQIFYCPSAPIHYNDRVPYNGRLYPKRQAAYRRCKQLNEQVKMEEQPPESSEKAA